MKTINELIAAEGLKPCGLTHEVTLFQDSRRLARTLGELVAEYPDLQGWLAMQSQVLIVRAGILFRPTRPGAPMARERFDNLSKLGFLVNGELGNGQVSFQWHQNHEGWKLVRLSDKADGQHWYDEVIHLGDQRKGLQPTQGNLKYRRYWRRDQGFVPFAARLITIEGGE